METRRRNFGLTRLAAAALAAGLVAAPLAAGAEGITGKGIASAGVYSRYVWRGQVLSNGVAIQPTVGITYGSFAATLWGNIDTDLEEAVGEGTDSDSLALTETDVTLSYTTTLFDKLTLGGGYIYYAFDGFADTQELYLTASYATLLNPTLSVYYDFDEGDGGFMTIGVSQPIPIVKDKFSLTAGATLGVNLGDAIMGTDEAGDEFSGLYYGEVTLATSIPLGLGISADPKIGYAFGIGDGRDAIEAIGAGYDHDSSDIFYGGVALTVAF